MRAKSKQHRSVAAQAQTRGVMTTTILRDPDFLTGFNDVRARRPFDDLGTWGYERGRQFAVIAPRSMRIRLANGRLNPEAIALLDTCFDQKEIV